MEKNNDENIAGKSAQSGGKKGQTVDLIPATTVNPSSHKTG